MVVVVFVVVVGAGVSAAVNRVVAVPDVAGCADGVALVGLELVAVAVAR